MSLPRFFVSSPLPRPFQQGQGFTLPEAVANHATRVLRLREDEALTLFDSMGGEFAATLKEIGKREAVVELTAFSDIERESPLNITLVQAITTGDKMDLIVQKAVELGVTRIQPIHSRRCTAKLSGERAEKRVEHWRSVAISACEQCGRNRVPVIEPIMDLPDWFQTSAAEQRFILTPIATHSLANVKPAEAMAFVIGPEGGFDDGELADAQATGVIALRLGPRVLRTETAGIAVLSALAALHGDFK